MNKHHIGVNTLNGDTYEVATWLGYKDGWVTFATYDTYDEADKVRRNLQMAVDAMYYTVSHKVRELEEEITYLKEEIEALTECNCGCC